MGALDLDGAELVDWHVDRASTLLRLVERQEEELARIEEDDPDRHLELVAAGLLGRLARNRRWSIELATGHALAAIALELRQNGSQGLEPEDRGESFR